MRIEQSKPDLAEYGFLRLLVSTLRLENHEVIVAKHQLEQDLYEFYGNEDFNFLFEDIIKKESIEGNNHVDLNESFQMAYAWGLLSMIHDSTKEVRSIINLSEEQAIDNLKDYNEKQVNAMKELVTQIKQKQEQLMVKDLESRGYKIIDKDGNSYWKQLNSAKDNVCYEANNNGKEEVKECLIRTGVLNENSTRKELDPIDENSQSFLKDYGVNNIVRYLVEIEIDEKKTIIQKIENEYVGDDCAQVMFKHSDGMTIIRDNEITFNDLPYDSENEFGYINDYLHDNRRYQFPYFDIPVHHEKVNLYSSYDCVNQLLDYDITYTILRADKNNYLESQVYCKAIKDGENAIIVQSVNENSPAFNMNIDELRNIASFTPQPKIRTKHRDKIL